MSVSATLYSLLFGVQSVFVCIYIHTLAYNFVRFNTDKFTMPLQTTVFLSGSKDHREQDGIQIILSQGVFKYASNMGTQHIWGIIFM